jgi:hypothetical protein
MAGQEEVMSATVATKGQVPAMPAAPKPSVNESKPCRPAAYWVIGEMSDANCFSTLQIIFLFFLQENNLSKGTYTPLWGVSCSKLLKGDQEPLYSELQNNAIPAEKASCPMLLHYPFKATIARIVFCIPVQ